MRADDHGWGETTRPGFEPGQREPKSLVLPLHYRVKHRTFLCILLPFLSLRFMAFRPSWAVFVTVKFRWARITWTEVRRISRCHYRATQRGLTHYKQPG